MNTYEELRSTMVNFTPEQLERFLKHPITQSILQAEEEVSVFPPATS